jgi:LPXTG-motif cell wall-anchored protein
MEDEMLIAQLRGAVYAVATLALLAPGLASAQPADKRTYFTFSGPVEMPGLALPAGQYEFRLANPDSSRNVIQVSSRDGKKSYGLFSTHTAQRQTASNDAEVRFMEAGAGSPAAIRTWWYPGERTGYEFVYPKQQARRIAQRSRQAVLTTRKETTTAQETGGADLTRVTPTGAESQVAENEPAEATPAGERQAGVRGDSGSVPVPSPASSGTVARNRRTSLPQTASDTPFIVLMGVVLLAAAAIVRRQRERII